jgi:UDP-3-O-[3-hydroxymyristoyl] N-acetylglucosamine deacetylase
MERGPDGSASMTGVARRARRTLGQVVERAGVGLHGGAAVRVRLGPGPAGGGVQFVRTDLAGAPEVRASVEMVTGVERCVRLGPEERGAATVEHLLAALWALEIDDARVELDAPELPALDGSAAGWVAAVDEAGARESGGGAVAVLVAFERVEAGSAALEPLDDAADVAAGRGGAPRLVVRVRHEPGRGLAPVELQRVVDAATFRAEIAPARTFCFEDELAALRAAGLGQGGSLENAVVLDPRGAPLNPDGLRWADEPARHKMLDAIGDLALLGARLHGRLVLRGAGHAAHVALVRKLVEGMR